MRRSPLPRPRRPLRARRPVPGQVERDALDAVESRSQGDCETRCGRPGSDWSHRVGKAQGGPWCPSNGLLLCRWCHSWCHRHPEHAVAAGLMLLSGSDPTVCPVWLPARRWAAATWEWRRLDILGGVWAGPDARIKLPPVQYPPDQYGSPRGWLLDPALTEETR